jgi:hypothetical protein
LEQVGTVPPFTKVSHGTVQKRTEVKPVQKVTARKRKSTKNVVLQKRKNGVFVEVGWTLNQVDR